MASPEISSGSDVAGAVLVNMGMGHTHLQGPLREARTKGAVSTHTRVCREGGTVMRARNLRVLTHWHTGALALCSQAVCSGEVPW